MYNVYALVVTDTNHILEELIQLIEPSGKKRATYIEASEESWAELRKPIAERFQHGMKSRLHPLCKQKLAFKLCVGLMVIIFVFDFFLLSLSRTNPLF